MEYKSALIMLKRIFITESESRENCEKNNEFLSNFDKFIPSEELFCYYETGNKGISDAIAYGLTKDSWIPFLMKRAIETHKADVVIYIAPNVALINKPEKIYAGLYEICS